MNQVWASDITYIPLAQGFAYLVAIIDWHSRLVLAWHLTSRFEFDPDARRASEVEVGFEPLDERRSRVTLEHRCFDRHGPDGDALRAAVDTPNGWSSILGRFAECAALR